MLSLGLTISPGGNKIRHREVFLGMRLFFSFKLILVPIKNLV